MVVFDGVLVRLVVRRVVVLRVGMVLTLLWMLGDGGVCLIPILCVEYHCCMVVFYSLYAIQPVPKLSPEE